MSAVASFPGLPAILSGPGTRLLTGFGAILL
jgi:hypothetical protein